MVRRSRVVAGIARSRLHRSYWNHCNCMIAVSCVIAGIVHGRWRCLLLASSVVAIARWHRAGITRSRWHRV